MSRSILFLVVALLGAVSAQNKWPMISVNAAGEIVLQSLTRAQSFVFTPLTVNTGPTTGSASASSATRIPSGPNVIRVLIPSGAVASHGVTLPSPVQGQTITFLESDTTFATSYIIYTDTGVFINADSTTQALTVSNRRTVCTAVTATRWDCSADAAGGLSGASIAISATSTTATITSATGTTIGATTGGVTIGATAGGVSLTPTAGGVTINPTAGNTLLTSTAGTTTVNSVASTTSVTSATGTTIGATAGGVSLTPTAGGVTINPTAGNTQLTSTAGTTSVTSATGTTIGATAGGVSISATAGGITLAGGAGGLSLNGGAGNLKYTGTITAGTAQTTITALPATARILCIVTATGVIGNCDGANCEACTAFT